jgi:hypothetical protein
MDTTTAIILVIAIIAISVAAWALFQRDRTRKLKAHFGPEYDRVLQHEKSARHAEAILDDRRKRVAKYHIRPLTGEERDHFAAEWRRVQEHFVDNPRSAVSQADGLINEALRARGYPMNDFEQQAADLSVDYPSVVENYRIAHEIAMDDKHAAVSTEDLRKAMQHYRSLFEDVLGAHISNYEEVHRYAK